MFLLAEIFYLFLHAKDFLTPIAHDRILREVDAEWADEFVNQLGFVCVKCLLFVNSLFQNGFLIQQGHTFLYLLGM